jgi:hypothetical protein
VEVKLRKGGLVEVREDEEGNNDGEDVVAAVMDFCCETVEAARVKGRPERREVWSLRRKVEENSLVVAMESVSVLVL